MPKPDATIFASRCRPATAGASRVEIDPDEHVAEAIRLVLRKFR